MAKQPKTPPAPPRKRFVRISLDLSPEANATLDALAERVGGSKADVLRRAVRLFELCLVAESKGMHIGAVCPENGGALDAQFVGLARPEMLRVECFGCA